MIPAPELRSLAITRISEAEILLQSGQFDGAGYLSGYALEFALKAKICETLGWREFPSSRAEFQDYQSFRTHDLDVLLHLSGIETLIREEHFKHWSNVADWSPEMRYRTGMQRDTVQAIIISARALLNILLSL